MAGTADHGECRACRLFRLRPPGMLIYRQRLPYSPCQALETLILMSFWRSVRLSPASPRKEHRPYLCLLEIGPFFCIELSIVGRRMFT
ncbi:MAG: hypothetical protein ACJ8G3_02065, partial [Burkholderiaceae bacterium]